MEALNEVRQFLASREKKYGVIFAGDFNFNSDIHVFFLIRNSIFGVRPRVS